jgi:Swi5-dependent recombination DNA repair protein 1
VNRMGGVGAWKEREKEAKERTMKWDLEERKAERERLQEAKENGEVDDEAFDRYAEMAHEQGENEEEDNVPKAADDDVSLELLGAVPHADCNSRSRWT